MRGLVTVSVVLALSLTSGATLAAEEVPAATGTFSPAGSLAEERVEHTSTLLPDGRVLIVGGSGVDDILASTGASAEVWDPATGAFGPAGSLAEGRFGFTATASPDGRVLVIGGSGVDGVLASAEVWDPATSLPTAGPRDFAVAFPDDWIVEEISPGGDAGHTSVLEPEMRSLLTPVVKGFPGHMHDWCVVVDFTRLVRSDRDWTTLDDVIAGFMLLMEEDSRWERLENTFMDLPAGRTGRIVRSVRGEARRVSTYYFTDSDAWFYLECISGPSSGRWRSIAKTFEFMPAEE